MRLCAADTTAFFIYVPKNAQLITATTLRAAASEQSEVRIKLNTHPGPLVLFYFFLKPHKPVSCFHHREQTNISVFSLAKASRLLPAFFY